jgi:hypothetical protein
MKTMIKTLLLIALACVFTSCASITTPSPQYSVQAETDGQIGSLKGESKSHFILFGLLQWGDSGIVAAAEESGGTHIRTVDKRLFNFLGLYGFYSTKVTTDDKSIAGESVNNSE